MKSVLYQQKGQNAADRYFSMCLTVGLGVPSLTENFAGLLTAVLYTSESIFV